MRTKFYTIKKQNKTSTLKEVFNDWASCNIKSVSNNLNSITIYEDIIDNIYDCLYQVENTPNYCYKTEDNVENLNLALMLLASGENNLHESGEINQKKSKEKSHYQF